MENDAIKRILYRERGARKIAEKLIEEKSRELYSLNNELKQFNDSLELQVKERTGQLEKQNIDIHQKNEKLERTQQELELKIQELKNSNKYKSEFLANMSHELRTPLNSILVLAKIIGENNENNLTPKQVEYSNIIHNSGKDLLSLINEILDLAKIEAGRVDIHIEEVNPLDLKLNLMDLFFEIARKERIDLDIHISKEVPSEIYIDKGKVMQILRNLLSNAFKFTEAGGRVALSIEIKEFNGKYLISLTVNDDGIGIAEDNLDLIFEAFQQADGSTSRKYGGTGLGLNICKELAQLMNGSIHVTSKLGAGSVFQVLFPCRKSLDVESSIIENNENVECFDLVSPETASRKKKILFSDDREDFKEGDAVILIIEDDIRFAKILIDLSRGYGYKAIVATQGGLGFEYAKKYKPVCIFLDIQLPVLSGWSVLKQLKSSQLTSTFPVHIISVVNKKSKGLNLRAETYNTKPVTLEKLETIIKSISSVQSKMNQCIIVGDSNNVFAKFYNNIAGHFNNIKFTKHLDETLKVYVKNIVQLIILGDAISMDTKFENVLIQINNKAKEENRVVHFYSYSNKPIDIFEKNIKLKHIQLLKDDSEVEREFGFSINRIAEKIQEKEEPSLDELNLEQRKLEYCKALQDKSILLVDDEMRNIFAMDSILEQYDSNIIIANNGKEALEKLTENPFIDIVLMDIMMPVMNGYETIAHIRNNPKYDKLPVIAVTAKAMKGDKEKSLAAGANDYISKPIDIYKFLDLITSHLN